MAIEFEKPQPLMLGDKAHYTLSSYEPVSIEVEVPFTTEEDVDFAIQTMLDRVGGTQADLDDAAWLAQRFPGVSDRAQLRAAVRAQLTDMNAEVAESQKLGLAVAELTKRLQQSVPPSHLARYRQGVQVSFEQQIASEGMTVEQFLSRSAATRADLEIMFDEQARQTAEQDAALDAYAREKKLTVSEDEFGRLLGIPASELDELKAQAKAAGQFDQLKDAALHAKAAAAVAAESSCSYHHGSEAEAHERIEQIRRMRARFEGTGAGPDGGKGRGSGFELV